MRRVLLMVFAIAAIMSLGTAGAALAQSHKKPGCDNSGPGNNNDKPGCRDDNDKPKKCKEGETRKDGMCVPKPAKCEHGQEKVNGMCVPKPAKCEHGQEKVNGMCVPKCKDDEIRDGMGKCVPVDAGCPDDKINVNGMCIPRPNEDATCSKASLVLLEDLLKGTGALACVFLGDNSPAASNMGSGNCPGALLALPLDHLIGVCVFLPPADVQSHPVEDEPPGEMTALAPDLSALGSPADATKSLTGLVNSLVSTLTGLLTHH